MLFNPRPFVARYLGWTLHALGASVAVCVAAAALLAHQEMAQQHARLGTQQSALLALMEQKSQLSSVHEKIQGDVNQAETALARMCELFPATAQEAEFLSRMSQLADAQHVDIHDFRVGSTSNWPTHQEVEISFRLQASHAELCRFLASLPELSRRYYITQLTIAAPAARGQDCSVDLQLRLAFNFHSQPIPAGAPR